MLIIGIAGCSASGKIPIVKKVSKLFPDDDVIIIPQDSFNRDKSKK
jgi:uridine kinase